MEEKLPKEGRYKHYKGGLYTVIGIARHSEDLSQLVVYRSEKDDNKLWVRPLEMFTGNVTVNGLEQARFKYIKS